jgi:hypothetical protein
MYLMYVDESGDSGTANSPTKYFMLSGMVFHELRWKLLLDDLITFRRHLRATKGLKLREEIHSRDFINSPVPLVRIKRHDRVDILKQCIDWCAAQKDCNVINVVVDKQKRATTDIFEIAWTALVQRFENTVTHRNFPGPANPDDRGLLIPDTTDNKKLKLLIRRMRRFNPIPDKKDVYTKGSRNLPLNYLIEDPFFKDSAESYFHQMVDVIAYCVRQLYEPNKYFKKKDGDRFFYRLEPILCKVASASHPFGIVEI